MKTKKILSLFLALALTLAPMTALPALAANIIIDASSGSGGYVNHAVYGNGGTDGAWPTISGAYNNIVVIENGGTVNGDVFGAWVSDSTANGNGVFINDDGIVTPNHSVYGGYAAPSGHDIGANENTVDVNGGEAGGDVYGGHADSSTDTGTATANDNDVTINGGEVDGNATGGLARGGSDAAKANGNDVTVEDGGVVGYYVIGGEADGDSDAKANGNDVTVEDGGEVGAFVTGGFASSVNSTATAGEDENTGNHVTVSGGAVDGEIIGGYAESYAAATANGNTVDIEEGGVVGGNVAGGVTYSGSADATANGNDVIISESEISGLDDTYIHGGYAEGYAATVSGNTLTISDSEIYSVYTDEIAGGGALASTDAKANGNTLNISDIEFNGDAYTSIYGGYALGIINGSATAGEDKDTGNTLTISGGAFAGGFIASGNASSDDGDATANGNTLTINSGTFTGSVQIAGGYAEGSSGDATASDNTVNIERHPLKGKPVFDGVGGVGDAYPMLRGGYVLGGGDEVSEDNTLNLKVGGLTVGALEYFQNMNFYLPHDIEDDGYTMIAVDSESAPAILGDVTVSLDFADKAKPPALALGDDPVIITLIDYVYKTPFTYKGETIKPEEKAEGIKIGDYTFDVYIEEIVPEKLDNDPGHYRLVAELKEVETEPGTTEYRLTVTKGTGGTVTGTASGNYAAGTAISVTAVPDSGYRFQNWTVTGVTITTADNPAEFEMPTNAVTLTANFALIDTGTPETDPPQPPQLNIIAYRGLVRPGRIHEIPAELNAGTGAVTAALTGAHVGALITDARDNGESAVTLDATGIRSAGSLTVDANAYTRFAEAGLTLQIKLPNGSVVLGPDAVAALADAAASGRDPVKVEASAVPGNKLTPMQAAQTKGYTVVNIDVFVGNDKVDVPMTVSLPYNLKDGEDPKAVCVWHLDGKGVLTRLSGTYDKETGMVTFTVAHQSYYAAGYDPVALWVNMFSDLSESAWYYDAVAFVSYYGYVGGDGKGHFMPDATLTRAMFATLVWNLEGKPRSAASGGRFTDVPFGAWYADAVQWAADSGIVQGTGDGTFNPGGTLTRQAMVTLLYNYAVYKGYDIPVYQETEDGPRTAAWAEEAARKLLEAGVLLGIDGGLTDNASRAEVAVLFRNFIRLVLGK